MRAKLRFILERRIAGRGKHPHRLVVDPARGCLVRHRMLVSVIAMAVSSQIAIALQLERRFPKLTRFEVRSD